jgi:hypothetical protein
MKKEFPTGNSFFDLAIIWNRPQGEGYAYLRNPALTHPYAPYLAQ